MANSYHNSSAHPIATSSNKYQMVTSSTELCVSLYEDKGEIVVHGDLARAVFTTYMALKFIRFVMCLLGISILGALIVPEVFIFVIGGLVSAMGFTALAIFISTPRNISLTKLNELRGLYRIVSYEPQMQNVHFVSYKEYERIAKKNKRSEMRAAHAQLP